VEEERLSGRETDRDRRREREGEHGSHGVTRSEVWRGGGRGGEAQRRGKAAAPAQPILAGLSYDVIRGGDRLPRFVRRQAEESEETEAASRRGRTEEQLLVHPQL